MKHSKDKLPARRAKSRFLAALPAVLGCDGAEYPCAAGDLSRTGVLLTGSLPYPASPDVEIRIATAANDLELRASARVMHVHEDAESNQTRVGVHFENLSEDQAGTIDLLVSRVVEGMAPAALAGIDIKTSVAEIRVALSKITPAHRLSLAARCGPKERAILKHDSDAHVLEALARNPNSNLPEIKNLLRRTDLLPSTLEIIATDNRWLADEEVKIQIATHPRVTFTTADKVVNRLNDLALARLIRRPGLHGGVKQKLMVKLSRKHRG